MSFTTTFPTGGYTSLTFTAAAEPHPLYLPLGLDYHLGSYPSQPNDFIWYPFLIPQAPPVYFGNYLHAHEAQRKALRVSGTSQSPVAMAATISGLSQVPVAPAPTFGGQFQITDAPAQSVGGPASGLLTVVQTVSQGSSEDGQVKDEDLVALYCTVIREVKEEGFKPVKRWKCDFDDCSKVSDRRCAAMEHAQMHVNQRPFACEEVNCTKSFVRFHDYKRHLALHSKLRRFPCSCGKAFSRADALTRHRKRKINPECADKSNTLQPAVDIAQGQASSSGPARKSNVAHRRTSPY